MADDRDPIKDDSAAYVTYATFNCATMVFDHILHDVYPLIGEEQEKLRGECADKEKNEEVELRIWAPECRTGDVALVLAAACVMKRGAHRCFRKVKIYATDSREEAIRVARNARYSTRSVNEIPEDYRSRIFRSDGNVHPSVRSMCVFAVHDALRAPPFVRLDLIYYAEPEHDAIGIDVLAPIFHYALKPGGSLALANADSSIEKFNDLFHAMPGRRNVFRRKAGSEQLQAVTGADEPGLEPRKKSTEDGTRIRKELKSARDQIRHANEELSNVIEEIEARNRELSRLNDDLTNLFGSINVPLLIVGPDLCVLRMNPAAELVFELGNSDHGKPLDEKRLGIRAPGLSEILARVVDSGCTHEQDVQDSHGHWYSMRIKPYISTGGMIEGAVLGLVDIHAIKQSRDVERRARADAETACRAKDQFLAILSHELRTPLTPMLGWVKMLKADNLDDARRRHGLDVLERSVHAQCQLIGDLLDISRIISGKFELKEESCDLASVLHSAVDYFRDDAHARNLTIDVNLDSVPPIKGDCDRLRQVFWNLLGNALKFTPSGGRIDVRMENLKSQVQIRIFDNGEGISSELLPFIFDRFRQGDSSINRKFSGLGLGLSIARTVVELHHGSICAESAGPGLGSTFIVTLPIIPADPGAGKSSESEDALPIKSIRALVVDDHAETREFISMTLEAAGATVRAFGNGRELLSRLESQSGKEPEFDVVISDLGMPDMDGLTLIREIRKFEQARGQPRMPAIALTAFAMASDRERAMDAGFDLHVVKPIFMRDLIEAVAGLVKQKK